jgi:hypothetical protein
MTTTQTLPVSAQNQGALPPVVEDLRAYTPSVADHMLLKTVEDRFPQNHIEIQL